MFPFGDLDRKFTPLDFVLASQKIPHFYGQKEEFPSWFYKVEQTFAKLNLKVYEMKKIVVSKLRGYALIWWKDYKHKRKKDCKEKVRTWSKLRGKLLVAFSSPKYKLKHTHFLPREISLRCSTLEPPFKRNPSYSLKPTEPLPKSEFVSSKIETNEVEIFPLSTLDNGVLVALEEVVVCEPDEGELLELVEIQEESLNGDELNQESMLNKSAHPDVQEDEVIEVLPLVKESLFHFIIQPVEGENIKSKLVSKEVLPFELPCDEYINVFNKLMGARTYCFEHSWSPAPESFKNSYVFKKGGVLSTLEYLQSDRCTKFSSLLLRSNDSLFDLLLDVGFEPLGFEDKSSLRGGV